MASRPANTYHLAERRVGRADLRTGPVAAHGHLRQFLEVIAHDRQANGGAEGLAIARAGGQKKAPVREGMPAENSLFENGARQGLAIREREALAADMRL